MQDSKLQHFRQTLNAPRRERGTARALSSSPSLPRITARVPAVVGAHTRGGGGLCSLLLSLLSDPSGSSDSLHSCSVTPRLLSPSLPAVCQCLSVSSPARSPSLCCLVYFHRSQPRSRRVEGSALPAQTAATSGRPRTNLPAPLLLPHGPAFLFLLLLLLRHHRRRLEGDPDLTVFLRPDRKGSQKASHAEGRATFPLCFENRRGWEGRDGEGGEKKRHF